MNAPTPRLEPLRRYRGGCQCGAVVFEARLDLASAHARSHSVWERQVQRDAFRLLRGEALLHGYQFSEHGLHHFFCGLCGTRCFAHVASAGSELYTVDLKCLHVGATEPTLPPRQAWSASH